MNAADYDAVLTQVGSIAYEQAWTSISYFLSDLTSAPDILLLTAEGTDSSLLADWVATSSPAAKVSTASLEATAQEPRVSLCANRVVVACECGQLLTPAGIDAAGHVFRRPPESYAVIFTAAEVIQSPDDLHLVERGIWQALAGDEGVRWDHQDLAQHRCFLWSHAEPAGFMTDRLALDRAALQRWLQGPATSPAAVTALRADYALQLAEREVIAARDEALAHAPRAGTGSLRDVQLSLEDVRRRLLKRADGDIASLDDEIASSLEILRGQLLRNIDGQIHQRGDQPWRIEDLNREVSRTIRRGMDGWQDDISTAMARRRDHAEDAAERLLSAVDWDLVNAALDDPGVTYPDVIQEHIRAVADVEFHVDTAQARVDPVALPGTDPVSKVFWVAASGTALAAVAALVIGPAIGPVVAAGAAGAMGGGYLDRHRTAQAGQRAAGIRAKAAVSRAVNRALDTARTQVVDAAASARRTVAADFRSLSAALDTAVKHTAERTPAASDSRQAAGSGVATESAAGQVAELRKRLNLALTGDPS